MLCNTLTVTVLGWYMACGESSSVPRLFIKYMNSLGTDDGGEQKGLLFVSVLTLLQVLSYRSICIGEPQNKPFAKYKLCWCICSRQLFKTLRQKRKWFILRNVSLSHNVFNSPIVVPIHIDPGQSEKC